MRRERATSRPPTSGLQRLLAVLGVAVGALVLGGLTSLGQEQLPAPVLSFANSASGWTMLAFLLVWLSRARPLLGAVLGVIAFEGLVEGYALVSGWRGFFYADPFSGIFSLVGLLAGPVLGAAAALTRHGTPRWQVLGVTPLVAVLIGEGVYGLTAIRETTSPVYWILILVLGLAFFVLAAVRSRAGVRAVLLAALIAGLGAAAFLASYSWLGGI